MRVLVPLAAAMLLGSGAALGKACTGVILPDQLLVDGTALSLNGLGLRQATFR